MSEKPVADISIIAPNYNNGRFLIEFVESIVNSTFLPRELIIIDDGSTDESTAVLERYSYLAFLRTIRFHENRGLTDALNAGLEIAAGKYIMRADPDDILHPERIERQYHYMETHPETGVAGCNVQYFHDKTGKNINVSNFPTDHADIVKAYKQGVNGVQHPTAIMRSSILSGYRYRTLLAGEDYELFSMIAMDGHHFANLAEPLYRMRIHRDSLTSNLTLKAIRNIYAIRDRIWGTKAPAIRVLLYYFYIFFYRKYQLATNWFARYCYMFLSGICFPVRIFKRLFRK